MQPGKLAWLPGPPFSLPTGDPGSQPASRQEENPLLVTPLQQTKCKTVPALDQENTVISELRSVYKAAGKHLLVCHSPQSLRARSETGPKSTGAPD